MMATVVGCSFAVLLSLGAGGSPDAGIVTSAPEPAQLFARLSPSVLVVDAERKSGSGVMFGPNLVATNAHVIDGSNTVSVRSGDRSWPAKVLRVDSVRDAALLTVEGLSRPIPRRRHLANIRVGERVYSLGAPQGLELTFAEGLVSAVRGAEIQTSAPISSGSSGGGLFDARGALLGITTSVKVGRRGQVAQNLNFALPMDTFEELLRSDAGVGQVQAPLEPAPEWDVVRRPSALRCRGIQRALFGAFPSGWQLLERTSNSTALFVHNFSSDSPTLSESAGRNAPGLRVALFDLRREDGFLQFESEAPASLVITMPNEGEDISMALIRRHGFDVPAKFEIIGAACKPATAAEFAEEFKRERDVRQASAVGGAQGDDPCSADDAIACVEWAKEDEKQGSIGSAAVHFFKACDLGLMEGCLGAARLYRDVDAVKARLASQRARKLAGAHSNVGPQGGLLLGR